MNEKEFKDYCKAGEIGNEIKKYSKGIIKRGMKLIEIANKIDQKIIEFGAKPAFPINLSLNEIAAHYTPSINDETIAEGLLKIDIGIEVNGYIADFAFSIDLTEKKEYEEMILLNEDILQKTLNSLSYNSVVSDIGNKLSELLKDKKFNIIKNLTGHSLERYEIHSELSIPNTANKDQTKLKERAIAIEPFLTTGSGEVIEGKPSEIFMMVNDKNIRDSESRKIMTYVRKEYKTKPFCKRWLDNLGFKTNFALKLLVKEKVLYNFPVLVEKDRGIISQSEETIVFFKGEKKITTI
jgi:methionyl aminopeptidase